MREPDAGAQAPPTLHLAAGAEFDGLVVLDAPARVDGQLRGLVIGPALEIGPEAAVEARVEVEDLVVAGQLAGRVVARRRIHLRSTARVSAELETPSLSLEEGSVLDGTCASPPEPARSELEPDPSSSS